MKKNKKGMADVNQSLGLNFNEIIVPVLIILAFVVSGGIIMINTMLKMQPQEQITIDVWEDAFKEVERNKVGITFEPINTTEETYNLLRLECNKYIEQIDKRPDIIVNVNTTVDEDIFVDGTENIQEEKKGLTATIMENAAETGPIYFNNKILLRYINDSGELKIVAASIDTETNDIIVSNKRDMDFKLQVKETEDSNSTTISENEYLATIKDVTLGIMQVKTMEELSKYQKDALSYFTLDGSKTVLDGRLTINKNNKANIEVIFIEAGKSSLNVPYKDRIYMQIRAQDGDETNIYGVILKLNQNSRIFDIDII